MDKIVDIITELVPIKKENGWPICYIARFRNDCIILHSYKLDWESREYVIADDPGYAVDVSKGMIMNDHADAIGDALLMAERLYYGNVKENVEAYHWNGDDKPDGSVSMDEACDKIETALDEVTGGRYSRGWDLEAKFEDMDRETYLKHIEEAMKSGSTIWENRNDKYHNEMAYIRGDITLLREKEYNENREKFRGRRGIPKITTIGKRVYENLISLLWLMDSDHPDSVELMRMAR